MTTDPWTEAARRLLATIAPERDIPVTDELVKWVRLSAAFNDGIVLAADGTIVALTFHLGRYGRTATAWYITPESWTRHTGQPHSYGLEVGLALGAIKRSVGMDVTHVRPSEARAALQRVRFQHARQQEAARLAELAAAAEAGDGYAAAKLARMAANGDRAARALVKAQS